MNNGSWRTNALPQGWAKMRRDCRDRAGGQCEAAGRDGRCNEPGNEAHHVNPQDHDNLVWLCHWHHNRITQQQATAARMAKGILKETRPPERHPGLH